MNKTNPQSDVERKCPYRNHQLGITGTDLACRCQLDRLEKELEAMREWQTMHSLSGETIHNCRMVISVLCEQKTHLEKKLEVTMEALRRIHGCHMSCEQPTPEEEREVHEMFNIAKETLITLGARDK